MSTGSAPRTTIARVSTQERHPLEQLQDVGSGRPASVVLDEIAALVKGAESFTLLTHVNPDGDALGCQIALARGLEALGKRVQAPCAHEFPVKYRGLLPVEILDVRDDSAGLVAGDVCFLLDTGDPSRAGPFEDFLVDSAHRRICLDHHPFQESPFQESGVFDKRLVLPASPSTGNLVLGLLGRLEVELSPEIRRALWIALATDTGWFRFANTTSWALQDAARLLGDDLKVEELYQKLYADYTPERARVLGAVLSGVRSELDGKLVWSALGRRQYESEGLRVADLDGLVDFLKSVEGAEVIALIVEVEPGLHKVSLRAPGQASVAPIARHFGGGGHVKAAGYRASGRALRDVVAALIGKAAESLEKDAPTRANSGKNEKSSG